MMNPNKCWKCKGFGDAYVDASNHKVKCPVCLGYGYLPDYKAPIEDFYIYDKYSDYEPQPTPEPYDEPVPEPKKVKKVAMHASSEDEALEAAVLFMDKWPNRVYEVEPALSGGFKVVFWMEPKASKSFEEAAEEGIAFSEAMKAFTAKYLYESKILDPNASKIFGGSFS